jgi:hypothetical protein
MPLGYILILLLLVASVVPEPFESLVKIVLGISFIFLAYKEFKDGSLKWSIFMFLLGLFDLFYYGFNLIKYLFFK